MEVTKCPFVSENKIFRNLCGSFNVNIDGSQHYDASENMLKIYGLWGIAKYLIFGARCDDCGNILAYKPK